MGLHSRTDYQRGQLDHSAMSDGPWKLLELWVEEAVNSGISDPTAFTLTSLDSQGFPHGRIVLLRDTRQNELVFFTNYLSEKGKDLERHPKAGAVFFWPHFERQIRVRGTVQRIPENESDAYFASRPRGSQLGAWSSNQSQEITSRQNLEDQYNSRETEFEGADVTRPPHWGGYALSPELIEFWQGRPSRMHDRLVCRLQEDDSWSVVRLQP